MDHSVGDPYHSITLELISCVSPIIFVEVCRKGSRWSLEDPSAWGISQLLQGDELTLLAIVAITSLGQRHTLEEADKAPGQL